jgi:hypothetical protein
MKKKIIMLEITEILLEKVTSKQKALNLHPQETSTKHFKICQKIQTASNGN